MIGIHRQYQAENKLDSEGPALVQSKDSSIIASMEHQTYGRCFCKVVILYKSPKAVGREAIAVLMTSPWIKGNMDWYFAVASSLKIFWDVELKIPVVFVGTTQCLAQLLLPVYVCVFGPVKLKVSFRRQVELRRLNNQYGLRRA